MKKLTLLLISLFLILPALAESVDWSKYDNIDNAWDGQKMITNKEFEETMKALEERKNRKQIRKHEKEIRKFKGKSLHDDMDAHKDSINSQTPLDTIEDCQLINIPVDFMVDNKIIEKGFYRIIGEKKDGNTYIELYQAQKQIAKIKAHETKDDFNEEFIQFAKYIPYNDEYIKLIFGCLEFNAYAYLNIVEPGYSEN